MSGISIKFLHLPSTKASLLLVSHQVLTPHPISSFFFLDSPIMSYQILSYPHRICIPRPTSSSLHFTSTLIVFPIPFPLPPFPPAHLLPHLILHPRNTPHAPIHQRRIHLRHTRARLQHFERLFPVRDAAGCEDDFSFGSFL